MININGVMDKNDLDSLLVFAKDNNLLDKPVLYVYHLWLKSLEETFNWDKAETTLNYK